ncbi:hypothetical protein [Adhaeribacter pallidiroseus]|uniref:Uncharacterized protein n=1 Tax=Adhaeribacter pallidiroseus TaxID=2072847 RepID=A0A369QEW8_9BACT|nr:hypothetical protein [Adhaeribacter pallidiroseus]RDC62850.1 hypothetical protein AHMF7616_01444 [Adhaeribacter pallidiroseus]
MALAEEDKQTTPNKPKTVNSDYHQDQANGNQPDPSAYRNVGPNGETERNDQKDSLSNLHIGGNETTGYGANDPESKESIAQGPGFEFEGSYDEMDGQTNGIRANDQPFGSKETKPEESDSDYSRI